jgi:hypothetical protein
MVDSTFFEADLPYFAMLASASLPAKHVLREEDRRGSKRSLSAGACDLFAAASEPGRFEADITIGDRPRHPP